MHPTPLDITWIFKLGVQVYLNLLILAIPVFFILKWLIKKTKVYQRNPSAATVVATIIATPLLYAAFVGLVLYIIDYQPQKDFNASTWASDQRKYEMADDLIERKILLGKDSLSVKELLGVPNRRTDSTYQVELRDSWMYEMGMGSWGFGVKFHVLIVKFDEDKVVAVTRGGTID